MHPAIYWIIGALVGLILEMLIPAFVIGSFGVSAFFAALAAWLGASLAVQIVVFAVLGFIIVVPARKYLVRRGPVMRLGAETLPGKLATCLEPIDGDLQSGVVQLDGARWTAVSARGTRIARGAMVEVVSVSGVRLFVREPAADNGASRAESQGEAS
jgi:membrane protein implicated in regulation of membrane protease activity